MSKDETSPEVIADPPKESTREFLKKWGWHITAATLGVLGAVFWMTSEKKDQVKSAEVKQQVPGFEVNPPRQQLLSNPEVRSSLSALFNPSKRENQSSGFIWSVKEDFALGLKVVKKTHKVGYETKKWWGYKDLEVTGSFKITMGYQPSGNITITESPDGRVQISGLGAFKVLNVEMVDSWNSAEKTKGLMNIEKGEVSNLTRKLRDDCIKNLKETEFHKKYASEAKQQLASRINLKPEQLELFH